MAYNYKNNNNNNDNKKDDDDYSNDNDNNCLFFIKLQTDAHLTYMETIGEQGIWMQ